ncbi:hypothetical protein [Microbacterium bovistercoris]|uniref:hypothetical protein n=1 Tax=Microbacterium bovistercoris TaxID=2293570 RepID=UPI0015F25B68|nr:hypothetical protein [Microbacterium bovistercoris]
MEMKDERSDADRAADAEEALREADAAVAAAKAEAVRWGGTDKRPAEPADRHW